MDEKTWLWKKRSAEKTLVVDKANNYLSRYDEEGNTQVRELEKTELERQIAILNAKLYSALSECNAKDNIAKKQVKIAEEAIIGWEKAETEAIYYKQEYDKVLLQKAASDERLGHLDAALKECMQQLRFVREQHDLKKYKTRVESEFNALMLRLESTEKENASLKYKVRVLEKEQVDMGSDGKSSCAESRASNFLLNFKNGKHLGNLEMNLMDDFAEMEKLAVVNIPSPKKIGGKDEMRNVISSMRKIVEILEGINIPSAYTVRVFQWKSDELSDILGSFVRTCNDLMNGTGNLEKFVREVGSNLEWVMNHCFSLQDVSSMKEEIRNHFDWDDGWRSESGDNVSLCEMEGKIINVHSEMESIDDSKGTAGNYTEKQNTVNEDLETKVMETKIEYLENEVENKDDSCESVDETCNEGKIKLEKERMAGKEVPDDGRHRKKQLQNDWEITEASQKLAECQETIINLGKQLKALASPNNAALFNKAISTPRRDLIHRTSLLDKMLAEDDDKSRVQTGNSNSGVSIIAGLESRAELPNTDGKRNTANVVSMDIIPCKKNGGRSFFKRLFFRRKKGKTSY